MYGASIKSIRKMKGLTQKEVYTAVVSKTFYSDFEAGKYSMSVDKFEGLLQNLSLSFEEFYYFHNGMGLTAIQELDKKVDKLYKTGDFEELYTLYEEHCRSSIGELRYLAAKAYLLVLITKENFYRFSREPFNEIISAVENVKAWTLNEIALAKLILLSFAEKEKERATVFFEKIKKELEKYQSFKGELYLKECADLFFNRIQSLLILNDVSAAKAVLEEYSEMICASEEITLHIQFQFIENLLALYREYDAAHEKMRVFLTFAATVPVAECRFYQIIYQIHNEKAKSYYLRYAGKQ